MNFKEWLITTAIKSNGEKISKNSVVKYNNAINNISKYALDAEIIDKPLNLMNILELEIALSKIFKWPFYIEKNYENHNMFSGALKRYRYYRYMNYGEIDDEMDDENKDIINKLLDNQSLEDTTKKQVIKVRVGQGKFRKRLIEKYHGTCVITGLANPNVLVASHIKPWVACENSHERLSVNNGILLSATYDKLFDIGLITFNPNGTLRISKFMNENDIKLLKLDETTVYDIGINDEMCKFLAYHNNNKFIR